MTRVVARYRDGRLVKGVTINFSPEGTYCHVQPRTMPYGDGTRVDFAELKALFFVRDLEGNPYRNDSKRLQSKARFATPVCVRFKDGEEVVGLAQPKEHQAGFFIYPADPGSNNERIFAIRGFVEAVTEISEESLAQAGAQARAAAGEARVEAEPPLAAADAEGSDDAASDSPASGDTDARDAG